MSSASVVDIRLSVRKGYCDSGWEVVFTLSKHLGAEEGASCCMYGKVEPMDETQNGAGTMTEAELEAHEAHRALVMGAVAEGVALVNGYLPEAVTSKQEYRDQIDVVVMKQIERQLHLSKVYEDILDPVNRAKYPGLRAVIHGPIPPGQENSMAAQMKVDNLPPGRMVVSMIHAPKRAPEGALLDLSAIGSLATFMGFLTSPALRALLVVHGLDIYFQQTTVKKPSSLIVPS